MSFAVGIGIRLIGGGAARVACFRYLFDHGFIGRCFVDCRFCVAVDVILVFQMADEGDAGDFVFAAQVNDFDAL